MSWLEMNENKPEEQNNNMKSKYWYMKCNNKKDRKSYT